MNDDEFNSRIDKYKDLLLLLTEELNLLFFEKVNILYNELFKKEEYNNKDFNSLALGVFSGFISFYVDTSINHFNQKPEVFKECFYNIICKIFEKYEKKQH